MNDSMMPEGSTQPRVTVILSTYNGGAFLQPLLDSLYRQTHASTTILVRDDGSTDSTPAILERERLASRIKILSGNTKLGAAGSFAELLRASARTTTDFVAFCDQDDIWLPNKIARAVAAIAETGNDVAAAYCSRLEIVDVTLAHVGFTNIPERIGFGNALVENICVGCTLVLNRTAIDLVCRNFPANVMTHDWWCYLVISCFGRIVYDADAHIRYRQHGGNVFGVAGGRWDRLRRALRRFAPAGDGQRWQSDQAAAFLAAFGDNVPHEKLPILRRFVDAKTSWHVRLGLAISNAIWRQRRLDDLVWRALILLNRY